MGAGALLAAAAIGTAPGVIGRLFGNLVSYRDGVGFGRRSFPLESDLGNSMRMKLVL
jgi:hypothetical protein